MQTKRNVEMLENIVSLDCEAFARKALVVRRRRYKRPSWCTLRFYVKSKLLKQKVVEKQWQFLLSRYIVVMVCGLEQRFTATNLDDLVDLLQEDRADMSQDELSWQEDESENVWENEEVEYVDYFEKYHTEVQEYSNCSRQQIQVLCMMWQ